MLPTLAKTENAPAYTPVFQQAASGHQIIPEEFSEFGEAYQSFTQTQKFTDDIRAAIQRSGKLTILVEGSTDLKYLHKAANLLEKETLLNRFELKEGGGSGNLINIWRNFKPPLTNIFSQEVLLLFDCDMQRANESKGNLFQRTVPRQEDNPIREGIENLFEKPTLDRARQHNPAFINIVEEHKKIECGKSTVIPEKWAVNKDRKSDLCDWLCENGTKEDFHGFQLVFALLESLLDLLRKQKLDDSV